MLTTLKKWRVVCAISQLRSGRSALPQPDYYYSNLACFGLSYNTACEVPLCL